MSLYYHAEYRVGTRGGRVYRSYSGFRAFLAILFDLVFGTVCDVVAAVITLATRALVLSVHLAVELVKLCWRMLVFVMTAIIQVLALPYRLLLQNRIDPPSLERRPAPVCMPRGRVLKPDWGFGREV
jgi:hypothetical protein